MLYKFVWVDGHLDYSPSKGIGHDDLWIRLVRAGKIEWNDAENYFCGYYDSDIGKIESAWQHGIVPTENELRFLLKQDMERFDRHSSLELPSILGATVEDTEPEYNFGFLNDPHKELYPAAFDGMKMRPEANKKIKHYVLQAIETGVEANADRWVYFTVYGSGASYNWDETGDFDVQMWVDIDTYNEHHMDQPLTSDELLAMVRRAVQSVNFPSFAELGLKTDCEGKMLIQYYPKPGKGTKEENLASKPYACYDMELDEWLQRPEPFTPEFYGESFLRVENKARDIADQADQLLSQFQRNILSWQFWTQLFSKYRNKEYRKAADDAKTNATIEQQGVMTLFEGVFGGRQKAYSPEGEGYKDERDLTQKLLEVWGVFQKLKHFARMPLTWDEQELPEEPESKESMWKEAADVDFSGHPSFTYNALDGRVYLGPSHDFIWSQHHQWYGEDHNQFLNGWIGKINGQWAFTGYSADHFSGNQNLIESAKAALNHYFPGIRYYTDLWDEAVDKTSGIFSIGADIPVWPEAKFSSQKFATWTDLMEKAQRLRQTTRDDGSPAVQIDLNAPDHVVGTVQGDHDTYDTEIWRDDPNSQAITMWDCTCPWSDYSWGRTRQWKKYEGRPCAHTLALFWEAQRTPVSDQPTGEAPPQPAPGGEMQPSTVPGGLVQPFDPSHMIEPVGSPEYHGPPIPVQGEPGPFNPAEALPPTPMGPQEPPAVSTPTQAGDPNASPLSIPGAFSHVRESAKLRNLVPKKQPTIDFGSAIRWIYDAQTDTTYVGKPGQHHDDMLAGELSGLPKWPSEEYWNRVGMGFYDPKNAKVSLAYEPQFDKEKMLDSVYNALATQGYVDPLKMPRQKVIAHNADEVYKYIDTFMYLPREDTVYIGAPHEDLLKYMYGSIGDDDYDYVDKALDDHPIAGWIFNENGDYKAIAQSVSTGFATEDNDALSALKRYYPGITWGEHVYGMYGMQYNNVGWTPRKLAALTNGQIVRCRIPLYGEEPTSGTPHIVPQNSAGEIIWSDGNEVAVIFPLSSGPLGPHLVKVFCEEQDLYEDPKAQPFIWKKHRGSNSLWWEAVEIQD